MRTKIVFTALAMLCLLVSCKVEPEPINFGHDACHFCKMTIVDQQHAAQYVTKKGKQFKFDAIECMVLQLEEVDQQTIGILLVSDYSQPNHMTNAKQATYLICKEIKSPMGAFLSGFENQEMASSTKTDLGGDLYTWQELLHKFHSK